MLLAMEKTATRFLLRVQILMHGQIRITLLLYQKQEMLLGRVLMCWNVGMRFVMIVTLN